jgi:hypothetical protein
VATEQRGEGEEDLRLDSRVRVFSRRQSGPAPLFSRPESPSAPRGVGMAWARRMDEGPNSRENEEPGARLNRFSLSG